MVPVIMSGGSGSRLWPQSRSLYPKQFLPLVGEKTMLQETVTRLEGLPDIAAPIIVCNENHRFMAAEQLRLCGNPAQAIILEPIGRNTAPAIAVAALKAIQADESAMLLVLAADHVITDVPAFHSAIAVAKEQALSGQLVTFGVVPTKPETGYGYIRAASSQLATNSPQAKATSFSVAEFVEKPDLPTAEGYVASGSYYWNSGMFMFTAARFLEELAKFNPTMLAACREAMDKGQSDLDFTRLNKAAFEACPDDSIDYAVMEPLCAAGSGVAVVPLDAGWSDVGSWSALWDVANKDSEGNVAKGDVMLYNSRNCYAQSDKKLVALVGLDDVVVVESDDAIMVSRKDRVQDVKKIVERLKAQERPEASLHRKVFRPWGYYDSIDSGARFQAKRIVVHPQGELSLQMHHHRAEHWIVVSGTAEVTKGEEVFLVTENQSTYIPLGVKHRLKNPGTIPLEMIEVQSGSYLGEDDIVRFQDNYGRE